MTWLASTASNEASAKGRRCRSPRTRSSTFGLSRSSRRCRRRRRDSPSPARSGRCARCRSRRRARGAGGDRFPQRVLEALVHAAELGRVEALSQLFLSPAESEHDDRSLPSPAHSTRRAAFAPSRQRPCGQRQADRRHSCNRSNPVLYLRRVRELFGSGFSPLFCCRTIVRLRGCKRE